MTDLWVLLAAFLFWFVYTSALAVNLLKGGSINPEGTICVMMGGQAEVAEWFIRKLYRNSAVMCGRYSVAVSVYEGEDDTAGILKILSAEKGFSLIREDEWWLANKELFFQNRVIDARGMGREELLKGPLKTLISFT
ncbi:MAG: hypothetical protein ACOY31_05210 [Bacillota bacterium]